MNYWLVKSEPSTWSWDDQVEAGQTHWDGVRNHQAANNLKAMRKGDKALFYHSGKDRQIVGIVKVVREYYPDPSDDTQKFGMVDLQTVRPLPQPVTLSQVKQDKTLANLALVRQSRLSVMPIDAAAWKRINELAGLK